MFDYFTLENAEQYTFYRVPKVLVKHEYFKNISFESKFLYGLFLDRVSLSIKNKWIDKQSRVFIYYTVNEISEDTGFKKDKISKLFKELISVKLIEKVRQGLNKPDIIYVKDFSTIDKNWRSEKPTSRDRKNRLQEIGKTDANNTDIFNNTDKNNNNKEEQHETKTVVVVKKQKEKKINVKKDIKKELSPSQDNSKELEKVQNIINENFNTNFTKKQLEKILIACKSDFTYLEEKINLLKQQSKNTEIKNVYGFLIRALEENYKVQAYEPVNNNSTSNTNNKPVNKNRICNYEGRSWDYKKIAELEMEELMAVDDSDIDFEAMARKIDENKRLKEMGINNTAFN